MTKKATREESRRKSRNEKGDSMKYEIYLPGASERKKFSGFLSKMASSFRSYISAFYPDDAVKDQ
jgi:hypothetical protein